MKRPSEATINAIDKSGGQEARGDLLETGWQRRDCRAIGGDHRDAAKVEHACQGDDEGGHLHPRHPPSLPGTHEDADGEADRDGQHRVHIVPDGQDRHENPDQGDRRPYREIEVPGNDQHDGADRRERHDGRLQGQQDQVPLGEERSLGREVEKDPDAGQHDQESGIAQRPVRQQPGKRASARRRAWL